MVGKPNRRWIVLVIVTAVFMSNLDLWIVNVALVDMSNDLHASLSAVSWVLNAYAVTLAALLVPAGRWGDRTGHRQVFLVGITVFTLASAACALSPNIAVLVVARVVQAAGAAAQLPTSLALLMAGVDPARRMSVARGWSAVGAVAAVMGPVLGGLLVDASWRWVFVVNLPVGAVALIAGARSLPATPARQREPRADLAASVLLVLGVGALTGALVEAPQWGWAGPRTAGLFVVSVVSLAVFLRRSATHPAPVLELPLLRVRAFAVANGATFLFSIAFAIMLLSNALWCEQVWHWSALQTGLAMVPGPAMVPVTTFASMKLVHRIGTGPVAAAGAVLFAVSMAWRVGFAELAPDYVRDLLPSMVLGGIGVGLALSTLIAAAATALPVNRSATASAIANSGRQVASALGVAVLVTILASGTGGLSAFRLGWVIAAGVAVLAGIVSLGLPRPHRVLVASPAPPVLEAA